MAATGQAKSNDGYGHEVGLYRGMYDSVAASLAPRALNYSNNKLILILGHTSSLLQQAEEGCLS